MLSSAVVLAALAAFAAADCGFPNGTDTKMNWWMGPGTGSIIFSSLTPQDKDGKLEYPVQLKKPLYVLTTLDNQDQVFNAGDLLLSIKLSSYGGFSGCAWTPVPTFGLLDNLDACTSGVPCPVKQGKQTITVVLDFTKYGSIIALLKNDAPYQIELILTSKTTKKTVSVISQARSLTK